MAVAAGVLADTVADEPPDDALEQALKANRQLARLVEELLAALAEAITARSRDSWHLHADETTWQLSAPREGNGPAKWWLRVFTGPDTVCFVMDPTRAGVVLARHAGIGDKTGQLGADEDGGPRQLVVSSDFYATSFAGLI